MLLSSDKSLLYHNQTFRAILTQCDSILAQYCLQVDYVQNALCTLSSSIHLHLIIGAVQLLDLLSSHFNHVDPQVLKVGISTVQCWYHEIFKRVREQVHNEKTPFFAEEFQSCAVPFDYEKEEERLMLTYGQQQ